MHPMIILDRRYALYRYLKRGSLSNVNSVGDCDGATQSERWWSFLGTVFHVISIFHHETHSPKGDYLQLY